MSRTFEVIYPKRAKFQKSISIKTVQCIICRSSYCLRGGLVKIMNVSTFMLRRFIRFFFNKGNIYLLGTEGNDVRLLICDANQPFTKSARILIMVVENKYNESNILFLL